MNLDEQLATLLTQQAEHADEAPPTMDGVEAVIGHRARRRKHQRMVGSGIAALCLMAGIAGGFALAGGDDGAQVDPIGEPTLPTVPLFGVDVSGLTLTSANLGPFGQNETGGQIVYAVFTEPDGSVTDPVIVAGTDPYIEPFEPLTEEDGVPIDLDGDSATDGSEDGRFLSVGGAMTLTWLTAEGQRASVGGSGVSEADLLEYVGGLDRAAFDVRSIPAPADVSHRELVTIPSEVGAEQSDAQYEGQGGSMVVLVTNTPGWFDLTRIGVAADSNEPPEPITLGPSPVGPGTAVMATDQNATTAVARTDSGLAIQITAIGLPPDTVRDILVGGHFVELEPSEAPATTTAIEPQTTTSGVEPVTPTTVGGSTTRITGVTIEPGSELDRLEIAFSGSVPEDYELTNATEAFDVDCHGPVTDNGAYLLLRLTAPPGTGLDEWEGTLQISPDPDGAIQGVLSCGWSDEDDAAYISIELDQPRHGETYTVVGQPILIIDVPRD